MVNRLLRSFRKRKQLWLSILIAFIMIFSAFGVMFYGFAESSSSQRYNGFTFQPTNNGFLVSVNGRQFLVGSLPQDLESFNISPSVVDSLRQTKMLYLTYDQNQSSVQEIATVQFQFQSELSSLGIYAAPAFTEENQYNLAVITCKNATSFVPVIEFKESNQTLFEVQDHCVTLSAAYVDDFSRLKDRLLLGMLGVMK